MRHPFGCWKAARQAICLENCKLPNPQRTLCKEVFSHNLLQILDEPGNHASVVTSGGSWRARQLAQPAYYTRVLPYRASHVNISMLRPYGHTIVPAPLHVSFSAYARVWADVALRRSATTSCKWLTRTNDTRILIMLAGWILICQDRTIQQIFLTSSTFNCIKKYWASSFSKGCRPNCNCSCYHQE